MEMAIAVIDIQEAGGRGAVFPGDASSADKQIGVSIAVKIGGQGHGGIATIGGGGEGVGVEG